MALGSTQPSVEKFREPQPPGALRGCTGLSWDSFTFYRPSGSLAAPCVFSTLSTVFFRATDASVVKMGAIIISETVAAITVRKIVWYKTRGIGFDLQEPTSVTVELNWTISRRHLFTLVSFYLQK